MNHLHVVILSLSLLGCAALLSLGRAALTLANQECAWRTPSMDVRWIKRACNITDALTPELEELLSAKMSAQRAGVVRSEFVADGGAP